MVEQLSVRPDYPRSELVAEFGPTLEFDRELAPLTTFNTGGRAALFLEADSAQLLARAVKAARRLKLPYFVIGGGSNLLVSDDGFDGLIIRVAIGGLNLADENEIICGAGEDLMALVNFATENSLTGLEFAAGIYGTVGGAVYGNAGAYGGEIKDVLVGLTLVDAAGEIKAVEPDYCRFDYRHSHLKTTREIVVDTRFRLTPGEAVAIKSRVDEILSSRAVKHPQEGQTCGCFFKNLIDPDQEHGKLPAGRLLEEAGAKGMSVGGAKVYDNHANMIVNTGRATSKDIRQLADILIEKVRDKFGITLEEEVIQIGNF